MEKSILTGKELLSLGYPQGPVISIAMKIMEENYKFTEKEEVMNLLRQILANPVEYERDAILGLIAEQLIPKPDRSGDEISLNITGAAYQVFGGEQIEQGAIVQMEQAARLPVGVIPGSMTAPGFIVKGKGEVASLSSASHGAGRKMSRTAALRSITKEVMNDTLERHGVKLLGGGLDEAPHAYKDIEAVMGSQQELVDTLGKFTPRIVKMDGTAPRQRKKNKNEGIVSDGE